MPQRIILIWHALVSPLGMLASVLGSLFVGVITADGVATSLTVVGLAFCAVAARALPLIKQGFLDYIELKGRIRRELDQTNREVSGNKSAIRDIRAEQESKDRKIKEQGEQIASLQAQLIEARRIALEAAEASKQRREDSELRTDIMSGVVLKTQAETRQTSDRLDQIERRSNDPDREVPR